MERDVYSEAQWLAIERAAPGPFKHNTKQWLRNAALEFRKGEPKDNRKRERQRNALWRKAARLCAEAADVFAELDASEPDVGRYASREHYLRPRKELKEFCSEARRDRP